MALTDQLVAFYEFEERFEQKIKAFNSVPSRVDLSLAPVSYLPPAESDVRSVAGIVGNAAEFRYNPVSTMLAHPGDDLFELRTSKTWAFWFKINSHDGGLHNDYLLRNPTSFFLHINATRHIAFQALANPTITHPDVLNLGQWYFVVLIYDIVSDTAEIRVNSGVPTSGAALTIPIDGEFRVGETFDGVIDQLGIWNRILTAAEMDQVYNEGNGLPYAKIFEDGNPKPCRPLECCNDNPASYVSSGGEGKGYDSLCEPLPRVLFEPLSGTRLIMPSLVALRSDNPDAVIHYTTDGSAPDRDSPAYSTPLTVNSPATVIRAIAIVDGCPEGPEANAQYLQWSPASHWTYGCGTVDKSGQWGAFAADGNADYNWQLQIQFTVNTDILQIDILQLFQDGIFTGSAWSTREFIYPWQSDPTLRHRSFPLVMWNPDHTGAQVNVAYQDDFSAAYGTFVAGAHTRTLYGSPWTGLPVNHLFKLRIVFDDGSTIERLIDTTCDALPPALCPVPDFTSAGYSCGPPKALSLDYSLTIGTPRKIFRATSPTGPFTEIASGNVAASPESYLDQTIVPDQDYYYYLSNIPTGCSSYVNGPVRYISALRLPTVAISANPSTINAGNNTTINWNSAFISGNVTITPTIGAQPGNVAGNQVVSPASTTVYQISGQNFCGDVATAQVTVTVIQTPTCGAVQPYQVAISGYHDAFFNIGSCGSLRLRPDPAWNGTFLQGSGCFWNAPDTNQTIQNQHLYVLGTNVQIAAGLWQVMVSLDLSTGGSVELWRGIKSFGSDPLGTYTRIAGCSSSPASLTLV